MSHPNDALIAEIFTRLPGCRAAIAASRLHGEVVIAQVAERLKEFNYQPPESRRKTPRGTDNDQVIERILRNILAGELVSEGVLNDLMRMVCARLRIPFDSTKEPTLVNGAKLWFSSSKELPELIEQIRARGVLRVGLLKTPWLTRYERLCHGPTEQCIQTHLRAVGLRDYNISIVSSLGTLLERLGNKSAIDVAFGVPATGQERMVCLKKSYPLGHLTEVHDEAVFHIRSNKTIMEQYPGFEVVENSPEHVFIKATWPRSSIALIRAKAADYRALYKHLQENPQRSGLIPGSQEDGLPTSLQVVNKQPVAILRFSDVWNIRRMPHLFR